MREIILHIGAPKSGSTFLQRALLQNRARLAEAGIAYPHDGGKHPGNARHIAELDAATFEALFDGGAHTVFLSHEDLFALEKEAKSLSRLARVAGVRLRKLVFLRPWSAFCFGDYSQHMKQNFEVYLASRAPFDGKTFEEMAAARAERVDAVEFFLRWARVVPIPPLTIARHDRIPETVEAMLGVTGLDWQVPRDRVNPSLRMVDCEAIAAMMRDPAIPDDEIRAALKTAFLNAGQPDPGRSPARIAAVEAMFDRQNRALLTVYGFDNRAHPEADPGA